MRASRTTVNPLDPKCRAGPSCRSDSARGTSDTIRYVLRAIIGPEGFEDEDRRVRDGKDALDDATTALHQTPAVDADWREEFTQDLAVLRSKLDILRTLMNGR